MQTILDRRTIDRGRRIDDCSPLAGLWYPTGLLIVASIVGLFFLPEVRNRPLDQ